MRHKTTSGLTRSRDGDSLGLNEAAIAAPVGKRTQMLEVLHSQPRNGHGQTVIHAAVYYTKQRHKRTPSRNSNSQMLILRQNKDRTLMHIYDLSAAENPVIVT